MPHFMIVLIPYKYQFIKPFLGNKRSIFEEYGAFKAEFNSIGFFTCKSWLSRLTSEMLWVNLSGLSDISSE